jgi:ABC-2 type transport system ATP-binding protein
MTTPALELRNVTKSFGPKTCLAGLDLTVAKGTVFGFLGSNGAGKTTTIRIVLGLLLPDAGEVRVFGRDPRAEPAAVRAKIGVLLDHDGHYERLTALHNLELHAALRDLDGGAAKRIEELLKGCNLWERRGERVGGFSKGMRQKLAIARALLHRPELVLLDEPFTGLDPTAVIELRENIRRLALDEGTTFLLTTHDLHHVEKICDQVSILEKGRVVASGAPAELEAREAGVEEAYVCGDGLTDELLVELAAAGAIFGYQRRERGAVVRCGPEQRRELGRLLVLRGVRLVELSTRRATLEERFVEIVS